MRSKEDIKRKMLYNWQVHRDTSLFVQFLVKPEQTASKRISLVSSSEHGDDEGSRLFWKIVERGTDKGTTDWRRMKATVWVEKWDGRLWDSEILTAWRIISESAGTADVYPICVNTNSGLSGSPDPAAELRRLLEKFCSRKSPRF